MSIAEFKALAPVARAGRARKPKGDAAQIRIPRKRQPNATEREWMTRAADRHPGCVIRFEPFTLNLPSGTKYTPDVVAITPAGQVMCVYEVKGAHIHNERSIHAFKEALADCPYWPFVFAQKLPAGWVVSPRDKRVRGVPGSGLPVPGREAVAQGEAEVS